MLGGSISHALGAVAPVLLLASAGLRGVSAQTTNGLDLYKVDTKDEIKQSSRDLAWEVMRLYPGNQTGHDTGILPGPPTENKGPYYWWQAGAMWGAMIDYWWYTGDDTYNKLVTEGIIAQIGEDQDFEPKVHRASLGNDDQGFWGMTAMLAAENEFPDPPGAGKEVPGWLGLAQAVWFRQTLPERQDDVCGGGLRWQTPEAGWGPGITYKNTIANGCYFNIGARLTRFTNNETYAKHAEQIWDWMWDHNYIDHETWSVYDGAHVDNNCTQVDQKQFSYNIGVLIQGAAAMWDHTKNEKWKNIVSNLAKTAIKVFFEKGAAYEIHCEFMGPGQCNSDMIMFKGFLHRWMAQVTLLAPFVKDEIQPVLRKSAEAALKTCTGPPNGRTCSFHWSNDTWQDPRSEADGAMGVGPKLDALSAAMSLLAEFDDAKDPSTVSTGGTSQGDSDAGQRHSPTISFAPITDGDRAGAAILTTVVIALGLGTFGWISSDKGEKQF